MVVRVTNAIVSLSRLIWKLCSLAATVTILRAWIPGEPGMTSAGCSDVLLPSAKHFEEIQTSGGRSGRPGTGRLSSTQAVQAISLATRRQKCTAVTLTS